METVIAQMACTRGECEDPVHTNGLCERHYRIARKTSHVFPLAGQGNQKAVIKYPNKYVIILGCIKNGLSDSAACAAADVNVDTFKLWLEDGISGADPELVSFVLDVERARTVWEMKCVEVIAKHIDQGGEKKRTTTETDEYGKVIKRVTVIENTGPDVGTAKWWLERRKSEEYGRHLSLDEAGTIGKVSIQINVVPHSSSGERTKKVGDDRANDQAANSS